MGILDNIKKTLGGKKASAGVSASAAQPAVQPGEASTYTVQSGDTLWRIASIAYGDGSLYPKIFEANKGVLKSIDHVFPGQELVIPPKPKP